MAPTNRQRYNGLLCGTALPTLSVALTNIATAMSIPTAFNYQGNVLLPTVADPNYFAIVIDADTQTEEIVWVTAYTSNTTTATILRGQEGTAAVAHLNGAAMVHGPTALDFASVVIDPLQTNAAATGAIVIDASKGHILATLTGNMTFTISNPATGQRLRLAFRQDATGTRTIGSPANVKYAAGTAPVWSTVAAYTDVVEVFYDGTNWIESARSIGVR